MRVHLLALVLLAGTAAPVMAQQPNTVERRIGKLESEMRAVQRKVFPGGNIEPEIRPEAPAPLPGGAPAGSAIADLTARVDALEAQLRALTGQAEESAFRLRQLETGLAQLRSDSNNRFDRLERGPAPSAEAPVAAPTPPRGSSPAAATPPANNNSAAAIEAPNTGDPAEDGYLTGYRLWETGRFADAQKVLEDVAKRYPKHRRASWAQNLAGRAYLDDGKPATAAKVLLANYQNNPTGERAADSLYFLGQSLMSLKKPAEACRVYDELQEVYGASMRDWVRQRLPKARTDAKCK